MLLPILRRAMEELGIDPAPFRFVSGRGIVIYRIPLSKCEAVLDHCGYLEAWKADCAGQAAVNAVEAALTNTIATEEEVVPPDDVAEAPAPPASAGQTMSSVVIAKLCGRSHNNVLRSIRGTLRAHQLDPQDFEGKYKGANNQLKPCYNLPRDKTWLVVEKYPGNAAKRIMQLWDEMEGKPAKVDFDPHTTEEIPSSTPGISLEQGVSAGDYTDVVPADPDDAVTETTSQDRPDADDMHMWMFQPDGTNFPTASKSESLYSEELLAAAVDPPVTEGQWRHDPGDAPQWVESETLSDSVPSDVDLTTWGVEVDDMIKDRKAAPQSGAFTRDQVEYFRRVKEMQPDEVTPPTPAAQPGLAIFNSSEFGVIRTITEDGKPFFCAKDVAEALGYENCWDAIKRHCRWVVKRDLPHPQSPTARIAVSFIPESDVYRLVMRSKLPDAERFQDWVVEEVLPTIRKTGRFEVAPALPPDPAEALRRAVEAIQMAADLWKQQNSAPPQQLQLQNQELKAELKVKDQLLRDFHAQTREAVLQIEAKDEQLKAWAPAVKAHDKFLAMGDNITMREAARRLGRTRSSAARSHKSHCVPGCESGAFEIGFVLCCSRLFEIGFVL